MNRIGCRIKCGLGLLAFVLLASSLGAAPVQDAMSVPKPGAVRPEGWLRDWALAAAKGYTGHMDEVDGEFVKAWREDFTPRGATLNWTANGTGKTGKWASNCTSPIEGLADANNIEEDPLFSTRKPWRLTADSPCCDVGDNARAPTGTDIDGRPRIFGRCVDIGCSEYVPSGLGIFIR